MERNLLSSARRLHDMQVSDAPVAELKLIDEPLRRISKAELLPADAELLSPAEALPEPSLGQPVAAT